jgi:DNA mismatch endonuclease (patch repair protein)
VDRLTREHRSWNMSRIRGRDTTPELAVRRYIHGLGYRYQLRSALPGKPDILFPRQRVAVFIHGCFWHRHGCGNTTTPRTNTDFWQTKFSRTIQRDAEVQSSLEGLGWTSVVLWECDIERDVAQATAGLRALLDQERQPL